MNRIDAHHQVAATSDKLSEKPLAPPRVHCMQLFK
jgi:hypothetical protein